MYTIYLLRRTDDLSLTHLCMCMKEKHFAEWKTSCSTSHETLHIRDEIRRCAALPQLLQFLLAKCTHWSSRPFIHWTLSLVIPFQHYHSHYPWCNTQTITTTYNTNNAIYGWIKWNYNYFLSCLSYCCSVLCNSEYVLNFHNNDFTLNFNSIRNC